MIVVVQLVVKPRALSRAWVAIVTCDTSQQLILCNGKQEGPMAFAGFGTAENEVIAAAGFGHYTVTL